MPRASTVIGGAASARRRRAARYQHVMADWDAAIARELNRLIEGG